MDGIAKAQFRYQQQHHDKITKLNDLTWNKGPLITDAVPNFAGVLDTEVGASSAKNADAKIELYEQMYSTKEELP
jgi:hypothetical protein